MVVGIFIFASCNSSSRITYKPSSQQILIKKFKSKMGDQTIESEQLLTLSCVSGGYLSAFKKEPIDFHYSFGEYYQDAKKLISIQAQAYGKDKTNQFSVELKKLKSDFELTYTSPIRNHKSNTISDSLFKLVPEKIEDANYPEMIAFDFNFTDLFEMKEYPEEIKVIITIKWIDAQKTVDYIVKKSKYIPNKISLKY